MNQRWVVFISCLSSSPLIVSLFSLPKDRKTEAFTYYHITINQSDLSGVLTTDAEGPNVLLGWSQEVWSLFIFVFQSTQDTRLSTSLWNPSLHIDLCIKFNKLFGGVLFLKGLLIRIHWYFFSWCFVITYLHCSCTHSSWLCSRCPSAGSFVGPPFFDPLSLTC